jgi:tetratricopeptide (TPR) repeat protein
MPIRTVLAALCLLLSVAAVHAQSSVSELNAAGWKLLRSGEHTRAARMFAEALALEPDDPILLFGAGASAHLLGRPKDAISRLQRSLRFDPSLTPASLLLGQIAYNQGEVDLAIATYEKALKYAPKDPDLLESLEEWRADADLHRGFEERRFDRFRVMFQGPADAALAAKATEVLDAAFWKIGQTLGASPSDPVVVMLYTERQFREVTHAPEWAGGLYDGRIRIPAAGAALTPQSFEQVLVHELTHAMISTVAPRGIPAWMHEGLAQYFEGEDVPAARRRLKTAGRVVPLRSLERGFGNLGAADARVAYDESLVAVETMLVQGTFSWPALFQSLTESSRTEYTLGSFGVSYADLEREF